MSLTKRGKVWWYEFVLDGIRHRGSTKLSNKDKARIVESAVRTQIVNGRFGIVAREPAPSFERFYYELIQRLRNKSESTHPRTVENVEQLLARIARYRPLASARLDQINDELLSRFVTWHRAAKTPSGKLYSAGSINKSLSTIRAVLKLAFERDKIQKCPNVSKYMLPEKSREFVLSGALRDEFIGSLAEPCRTVTQFLLDTGLRVSECCELTWDRVLVDEERGLSYIYIDKGKSKNARRYILLTPEAKAIVEKQRTISRSNFVFVRFGDRVERTFWYVQPVSRHTVSHQFMRRRKEMGLPEDAVLHSTRHTYLTDLGASGADAYTLKAIAGHASVTTSERYIHPVSDTLVRAMERLIESRKRAKDAERPQLGVAPVHSPSGDPTNSPTADDMGLSVGAK